MPRKNKRRQQLQKYSRTYWEKKKNDHEQSSQDESSQDESSQGESTSQDSSVSTLKPDPPQLSTLQKREDLIATVMKRNGSHEEGAVSADENIMLSKMRLKELFDAVSGVRVYCQAKLGLFFHSNSADVTLEVMCNNCKQTLQY